MDKHGSSAAAGADGEREARVSPWPKAIAHLDLDAFFAQAEELDDPSIRGRPVIVGPREPAFRRDGSVDVSKSGRGIVCTANYAARAFGVRTAMPAARAHRLCPQAVYRKPRGWRYRELADLVFAACAELTPIVRPVGIDEGYLDLTGLDRSLEADIRRSMRCGDVRNPSPGAHGVLAPAERNSVEAGTFVYDWPLLLIRRIQRHVKDKTGLDVSLGVGPNRFIAKLASDYGKPRGATAVRATLCAVFVASLPLRELRGVGPATAAKLERLGVRRSADIVNRPREQVMNLLGDFGVRLWDLAHGAPGDVPAERERRKSISRDTTFSENVPLDATGRESLTATAARLLENATFTLRREALYAATVGVRLRFADFSEVQHEMSLAKASGASGGAAAASDHDAELFPVVVRLLDEAVQRADSAQRSRGVRLLGVKLSSLRGSAERQMRLGEQDGASEKRTRLYSAADAIRAKLGHGALTSARALPAARKRRIHGATLDDSAREGMER